jgi:hypothetical protein
MAYENITKINIIGAPELPIPTGMTVETVMDAMGYNLSNYEQSVEGTTLVLAAAAGSKGSLDVRVVDGKVLPRGGKTFPTDRDIDAIAQLFPDDNLFQTLEDPEKLQTYFTALEENAETLIKNAVAKTEEAARQAAETSVDELKHAIEDVEVYASKLNNPAQAPIVAQIKATTEKLKGLLTIAEEFEIQAVRAQEAEEDRERVLAAIREAQAQA